MYKNFITTELKHNGLSNLLQKIKNNNCKCRVCGEKINSILPDKIKCSNCNVLLGKIRIYNIDYTPTKHLCVLNIDMVGDNFKSYYIRRGPLWNLSAGMLETEQLGPIEAIKKEEEFNILYDN